MNSLKAIWSFVRLMAKHYQEDDCQATVAALTYQTLFAVVPLVTITYTVLSLFEVFSGMADMLHNFLFANIVPETVSVVQEYLQEFSDQAQDLSLPSVVVLVVTAFLMMFTIEKTFNKIWRVAVGRRGSQRLMMYVTILILGPPLVGAGLVTTTYLMSLPLLSDVVATPLLLPMLPVLLNVLFFTVMYIAVPNCFVPLRHAFVGGLVAAMLFELVKRFFGVAMAQTDFQVIYGAYAAVPLFLLWVYLSWSVVLFGAELTKGFGLYRSHSSDLMEPQLVQILLLLELFFQCHKRGEVVTEQAVTGLGHRVDMQRWHDYKKELLSMGIIRSVDGGGLVLSKDLNEVTLWDLYREMGLALPESFTASREGWEATLNEKLVQANDDGQRHLQLDLEDLFRGEAT